MGSKISILPLISRHVDTLRNERTGSRWGDVLVQYGLPITFACAWVKFGGKLQGVGDIVAGVAVMTGFLFALVVFIFQLRIQVANDPRIPNGTFLPRLLDELFANVNYAVLVGLLDVVVAMTASSTRQGPDRSGQIPPLAWGWTLAITTISIHLIIIIAMCLKRTQRAYSELVR